MFRKVQMFILTNLALTLTLMAKSYIGLYSCWWSYEPEIPECLKSTTMLKERVGFGE